MRIKKFGQMSEKNRKIIYSINIILALILFGNLHPFYLFLVVCNQFIFIFSYENHLLLKNNQKNGDKK